MTKDELLAEEHICNGKCQDDITRNYVHCKTCTRLKDFLAGYKAGKATIEKENAELKKQLEMSNKVYNDNLDYSHHIEEQLTKAKEILLKLLKEEQDNMYWVMDGSDKSSYYEVREQAKQFLKEVEK